MHSALLFAPHTLNNPITFKDPSGHWADEGCGSGDLCELPVSEPPPPPPPEGDERRGSSYETNLCVITCTPGTGTAENLSDMMLLAYMQYDTVYLIGNAIEKIQNDPAFRNFRSLLLWEIYTNPAYGKEAFPYAYSDVIAFGGETAPGSKLIQFLDMSNPRYSATWDVAKNELTWMLRHASISAAVQVSKDGQINISYEVNDVLDLEPRENAEWEYNVATHLLGGIWHDTLGASPIEVYAKWTESISEIWPPPLQLR